MRTLARSLPSCGKILLAIATVAALTAITPPHASARRRVVLNMAAALPPHRARSRASRRSRFLRTARDCW